MPFGGLLTAGISAGGSLLGGLFGSSSAKKAAKQQADAALKALDVAGNEVKLGKADVWEGQGWANNELNDAQRQQLELLRPYIESGTASLENLKSISAPGGGLDNKFKFGTEDLQEDPGYKFALQQGQEALQRSAAANGKLFSGQTLKSLGNYVQGAASTHFNDAFTRALQTFNTNQNTALNRVSTLKDLANFGYGATNQADNAIQAGGTLRAQNAIGASQFRANMGTQYSNAAGNILTNKGNAEAAGTQGSTNAWLNALDSGTKSITNYLALKKPSIGGTNINSLGGLGSNGLPLPPTMPELSY